MRRVTIRDVAAEAGVSIGTASKALNGQGKLRAETRERVAEAARASRLRAEHAGPGPARGPLVHRGPDHHRQLRPVQHPGHARRRGRARHRPGLGVHVRHQGRPGARAALRRDAGRPPGGRPDRHRPPGRAAAPGGGWARHPGRVRDDPAAGRGRARGAARRRGRRARRRRAPARRGPTADRAHHRAGAVPGRAQARGGVRRARSRRRRGAARRRAVRRVERALGPGGGRPAARRPAGHRRDLLRQRPDRPRRGRHVSARPAGPYRATSRWSASTTGSRWRSAPSPR